MKITRMAAMVAAAAGIAWGEASVTVCMQTGADSSVTYQAQAIASRIFTSAGIEIEWKSDRRVCLLRPQETIMIRLSTFTPASDHPGALAYALPYEGVHIVVFYDRVLATVERSRLTSLMGHVLAHEITHILEGVNRHSEEGVMKASWSQDDYTNMAWRPLTLTATDVDLIRLGLKARSGRTAAAALVASR
jgi:hypothetical protein